MKNKIRSILSKSLLDDRTRGIVKNIFGIGMVKSGSILLNLLILPITIAFVNPSIFGIWVTLSSMMLWIGLFDIGFSNGLRNKLTEAIGKGDYRRAKELVSTTYVSLAILFFLTFTVLMAVNYFLDWGKLIQLTANQSLEVKSLVYLLIGFFCAQFVLRIVNTICVSNQQPFAASLIDFLGQALGFFVLLLGVWGNMFEGNLFNLGLTFTISPILILVSASVFFFTGRYKQYSPSLKFFRRNALSDIYGLGFKFFVIQIAGLIQYQSVNFLIARNFPSENVAAYNVAYKYFSVLNMVYNILLFPQWSAVTDAFANNDMRWVKRTVNLYLKIALLFAIIGFIMILASSFVFQIWLGESYFDINRDIVIYNGLFFIIANFSGLYISTLNGMGIVRLQYYLCFVTPILFVGIYYLFYDVFNFGIASILIATIISNVSGFVVAPIQFNKILQGKKGLWAK